MKNLLSSALIFFLVFFIVSAKANHSNKNFFIENKGQWPEDVKYLAQIGSMNAWITNDGVVYDYYLEGRNRDNSFLSSLPNIEINESIPFDKLIVGHVVKTSYNKCNPNPEFQTKDKLSGYFNYFLDNDKTHWQSNVPIFESILVKNIYHGIDIRYYFDKGYFRYDFIVKPKATYQDICLTIKGIDGYEINRDGSFKYQTSIGKVINKDIIAIQNGNKIKAKFVEIGLNKIGIDVSNYSLEKELIIDPLVYATYIGGNTNDILTGLELDSDNNAVISGYTISPNYPSTVGAYQTESSSSRFITKLNNDGSSLIFSTLLGTHLEMSYPGDGGYIKKSRITIDSDDNIYLTGTTVNPVYQFPTTEGAYRTTGRGVQDVFVSKINSTGTALIYSTYLGGGNQEFGRGVVIDDKNNVYVTGITISHNFPTTPNAFQDELTLDIAGIENYDIFVSKFNSDASDLLYSTYVGGSAADYVSDIVIDPDSNIYITGSFLYVTSNFNPRYPTTLGAFDQSLNSTLDGFITKLDYSLNSLVFSTYLGGSGGLNFPYSIGIDNLRNVYVGGWTSSSNFPITSGAFDEVFGGGDYGSDGFVTKLNSSGSDLIYSTFINGADEGFNDKVSDIFIKPNGDAFITGYCISGIPTTSGSYLPNGVGGFCSIINSSGDSFLYSTYLSNMSSAEPYNLTTDSELNIYVSGQVVGDVVPVTSSTYQNTNGGGIDGFVLKLKPEYNNILLNSKIFLEGPYYVESGKMGPLRKCPLLQPYNRSPWHYSGTESVGLLIGNMVDWILVELRDKNDPTIKIATRAAFIMQTGEIYDLDGQSPVSFDAPEDDYFIVIKHRNHLPVMSFETIHLSP